MSLNYHTADRKWSVRVEPEPFSTRIVTVTTNQSRPATVTTTGRPAARGAADARLRRHADGAEHRPARRPLVGSFDDGTRAPGRHSAGRPTPPRQIRVLRDYTRLRVNLTAERVRHWQPLEKLLEDALIKITSVASRIDLISVREMIDALVAGQRNPKVLAGMARGRMRLKHADLVEALTGQFDDHHAELARMLLDQIDALTVQIDTLTQRIDAVLADMPIPPPPPEPDPDGDGPAPTRRAEILAARRRPTGDAPGSSGPEPATRVITALDLIDILDEIPGIGRHNAQEIIAEIGLDMTRFPTAEHLVSWAKLCPRTIQSGNKSSAGKAGKGNRYLRAVLGDAAAGAAKTQTFLGDRYRRLIKRRGKIKTLVAVARSILVIIWNLLAQPGMRYYDLGVDFHTQRIDTARRTRNHVRQLEALGYTVTLTAAA